MHVSTHLTILLALELTEWHHDYTGSTFSFTVQQVARLPALAVVLSFLVISALPLYSLSDGENEVEFRDELEQEPMPLYAPSPGHSVFGEYVGAHWCPPCMDSASPSLANLKDSNPDEFTFVSFFESSSDGYPNDSPLGRISHVSGSSSGIPVFSFADQQSSPCMLVGAAGNNYYDSEFSNGGCMSSDSPDFELVISMSLDSTSQDVSVSLGATYTGSQASVDVYVYGAITEKVGKDAYDNGVKPHHNWRGWLLNDASNGFKQLTLVKDVQSTHSWTAPLSLVRATGGYSQWENFWPVFALMDGPHSTYNTVLAAVDPAMGPLIDVGISTFSVENRNQMQGFVTGDILDISIEVTNNGEEPYSDGGEFGVFMVSGSEETQIGSKSLGNMPVSGTDSLELEFDTSGITMTNSGATAFRARLSDLTGDRNSTNDANQVFAPHDLPPTPLFPASTGPTSIERGDDIQFEAVAMPNDLVDDISTMSPTLEYSKEGQFDWKSAWAGNPQLVGSEEDSFYLLTIQTPTNGGSDVSGMYDIRVKWADASGQDSDWLVVDEAFELRNALPRVLGPNDPGFAGYPTVKVESLEIISLTGLVLDAETQLSMLSITSSDPAFKGWDPITRSVSVEFESIATDSSGNPILQGIFITIGDGEDENSGMLLFNVIENGAPRWFPMPPQPILEGGSTSIVLTPFLSDTDENGDPQSPEFLFLSVVSNGNEGIVETSISGHTLEASTVDDDSTGTVELIIRASDGLKSSDTTIVLLIVNVNDAPTIDLSQIADSERTMKVSEELILDLSPMVSDIDGEEENIWLTVDTEIPGAAFFDRSTNHLTLQWEEPGTHQVTFNLRDRFADSSTSEISFEVFDSKPLTWSTETETGDLEVDVSGLHIGHNATIEITNSGNKEISELTTQWSICNSIVGVCHTAGVMDGFGQFVASPSSGNGMARGDYLTLSVSALDADGWELETGDYLKLELIETDEDVDSEVPAEEGSPEAQQSNEDDDPGNTLELVAYVILAIVLVIGGAFAGIYLSKVIIANREQPGTGKRHEDSVIDFTYQDAQPEAPSPPAPQHEAQPEAPSPPAPQQEEKPAIYPPLPEDGLPEGWTIEQWKYYGEEYLKRQ